MRRFGLVPVRQQSRSASIFQAINAAGSHLASRTRTAQQFAHSMPRQTHSGTFAILKEQTYGNETSSPQIMSQDKGQWPKS